MPPPEEAPLAPRMSANERLCFAAAIAGRRHLVEYGVGGSTLAALARGVGRIDSVESDPAWIARLEGRPEVRAAIAAGRLALHHADIGPVGDWGFPTDASFSARWPAYAQEIWARVPAGEVDAVLVDGRFRAACVLAAVTHARPGTPIIVHDFWNRPEYGVILPAVVPMLRADTLAILVARLPIDRGEVGALARSVALQAY
jgi:hypothetical protein